MPQDESGAATSILAKGGRFQGCSPPPRLPSGVGENGILNHMYPKWIKYDHQGASFQFLPTYENWQNIKPQCHLMSTFEHVRVFHPTYISFDFTLRNYDLSREGDNPRFV